MASRKTGCRPATKLKLQVEKNEGDSLDDEDWREGEKGNRRGESVGYVGIFSCEDSLRQVLQQSQDK